MKPIHSYLLLAILAIGGLATAAGEDPQPTLAPPAPLFQPTTLRVLFTPGPSPGTYAVVFEGLSAWQLSPIGSPVPPPPTPPTPPVPPPVPPPQPPLSGLALLAQQWATEHVPAASRGAAAPLGASFKSLAERCRSGDLAGKDQAAIVTAAQAANAPALGEHRAAWDTVRTKIADYVDAQQRTGALGKDAAAYAGIFGEIAAGLARVEVPRGAVGLPLPKEAGP